MLKIVKGDKTLLVPSRTIDVYLAAGWSLGDKIPNENKTLAKNETYGHEKETQEPVEEPEEDFEEEVIYVDPEELLEKPLNELDFEELKIVAEYLDIDTKELRSSKALRAAIKKAQ